MRIISGWAKGRKLHPPPVKGDGIRPTSDKAREAVFSIIGSRIKNAVVFDLFAGSGALGIEAMSRGASRVCFVDSHPLAIALIKENIALCMDAFDNLPPWYAECDRPSAPPIAMTIKHDLRQGLPFLSRQVLPLGLIDLLFVDPPYSQGLSLQLLQLLDTSPLLHPQSLIVMEERKSEDLPERLSRLTLTDQRKYGEARFWFYQPAEHLPHHEQ